MYSEGVMTKTEIRRALEELPLEEQLELATEVWERQQLPEGAAAPEWMKTLAKHELESYRQSPGDVLSQPAFERALSEESHSHKR